MYAYLRGTVEEIQPDYCVIDVNGVGYNVRISSSTASNMPGIGQVVKIYTYTSVREDAIQLVGFLTNSDLKMFRQLITVNGIGPKGGLAILSVMDADAVRYAILTGDVNAISKAPGIGKKSAERLILELRGKVDANELLSVETVTSGISVDSTSENNMVIREAAEALTALGYNATEALKAVKSVDISETMDVEAVLKLALKELY